MKKAPKSLKLAKETLRTLEERTSKEAVGGISAEYCSHTCLSYCEYCNN